jgi:hypothetical protein
VRIQPKVVDAGHHTRRLQALTGLDVEDNQARRLLSDLDAYAAAGGMQGQEMPVIASRWLTDVFDPVVQLVPPHLRGKLEPAEIFHEILEHRWYLSERAETEVDILDAAQSYLTDVLSRRPDEQLTPAASPDEAGLAR